MSKRVWWYPLIIALLLVSILPQIHAEWTVRVVPVLDRIFPGQEARFEVYIENSTYRDEFKLELNSVRGWSIFSDPSHHLQGIPLERNEIGKTTLLLKSDSEIPVGFYNISLGITSTYSQETKPVGLVAYVRDPTMVLKGYTPAINVDVVMPEPIDPRQEFVLRVNLWNRNRLNLTTMKLNVYSSLFNVSRILSLHPLEKKSEEFRIVLPPQQAPIEDALFISFDIGDNHFAALQRSFRIQAYNDLQTSVVEDSFLFKTVKEIHLKNAGNTVKQDSIQIPISILGRIFTSTTPQSNVIKQDGVRYLSFIYELQPNEERVFTVTYNYRPFVVFIILCIIGILAYYLLRSPLVIKKETKALAPHEGLSTVKILLHVKNRTAHVIENVTIVDSIPSIAHLAGEFPVGTLQPEKVIKNHEKGTLIKWQLPLLESFEERILVYTLTSRLKILGHLHLPAAIVKFKTTGGTFVKIKSSKPLVGKHMHEQTPRRKY